MKKILTRLWRSANDVLKNTTELFQYDKSKMEAGTMYSYKVSNFKGNRQINMYVYTFEDNKIEFYKDYSTIRPMVSSSVLNCRKTPE